MWWNFQAYSTWRCAYVLKNFEISSSKTSIKANKPFACKLLNSRSNSLWHFHLEYSRSNFRTCAWPAQLIALSGFISRIPGSINWFSARMKTFADSFTSSLPIKEMCHAVKQPTSHSFSRLPNLLQSHSQAREKLLKITLMRPLVFQLLHHSDSVILRVS